MKRAFLMLAALAGMLGGVQQARADFFSTFDLTWSGASFGNNATATGVITLDISAMNNPGITTQNVNPFVTDFSITISGASSGNGTFGFADFNGTASNGGFRLDTDGGTLDFTKQLVGQATMGNPWGTAHDGTAGDFNIFSNGKDSSAPKGTYYFQIRTDDDKGDRLLLTSFQPASVVPAPSSITLCGTAFLTALGFVCLRRRKLAFLTPA